MPCNIHFMKSHMNSDNKVCAEVKAEAKKGSMLLQPHVS